MPPFRIVLAAGLLVASVAVTSTPAQAEIAKLMTVCAGQLCPSFTLKLTPPKNWVEDAEASKAQRLQVMVPRGKTFSTADAVMYVKVSVRRDTQELADFVRVSQERWREAVRDTKIVKQPDVERANGQVAFQVYRYENPSRPQQRFEAVSFSVDRDKDGNNFFVMVALTGMQKKPIDQAMKPYQAFLRAH